MMTEAIKNLHRQNFLDLYLYVWGASVFSGNNPSTKSVIAILTLLPANFNPFINIHHKYHVPSHLLVYFDCLYCKHYGPNKTVPYYATFHPSLHCLSKYPFSSFGSTMGLYQLGEFVSCLRVDW